MRLQNVRTTSLLTLTSNPSANPSREAAFRRMSLAVNILVKRIRRNWPSAPFEYFLIWETTKAGWPHAHLLLRAPRIPQRWLSATWAQLTGAPIVDIRSLRTPEHVCSYIAKYLSKDPAGIPHLKRYRSSRGFFDNLLPSHLAPGHLRTTWKLVNDSPFDVARQLSFSGMTVRLNAEGGCIAYPPGHQNAPRYDSPALHPELAPAPA